MSIRVSFYSFFRDLAGVAETTVALPPGARVADLVKIILDTFPKLQPLQSSARVAVGLDYQPLDHPLRDGDDVALFPPVQGG